jgi:DedD protein
MAESPDVDALKRRGRRRLIGAIALVLLAVIILPMVFDAQPRQSAPPVSVRIPDEDEAPFKPKVTPKGAPEKAAEPAAAAPSSPTPAPASPPPVSKPAAAPTEKTAAPAATAAAPQPKPAAKAPEKGASAAVPAPAAPPSAAADSGFYVPVAALADPAKLKELTGTLAAAKLPYYTEPVATAKGPVTRVRAGPFASREAATRAVDKLKSLGLKPGNVAAPAARNG